MNAVTFQAIFSKATTLVDGGWRVSFDLSQESAEHIMELAKSTGKLLQLAVVPIEQDRTAGFTTASYDFEVPGF